MARPSKNEAIDYTKDHTLSHGLLERAACPDGKPFVLVRDAGNKGLRLRVTPAGGKHWQFETRIQGKLFTRSLGAWPAVPIVDAQKTALNLRTSAANKIDPRETERQQELAREAERQRQQKADEAERQRQRQAEEAEVQRQQAAAAAALTVGEVWPVYLAERRPHWGDSHAHDHVRLAQAGGVVGKRGTRGRGVTVAGPLNPLMGLALVDLTAAKIEAWAATEGKTRPTTARLAWRLLKAFMTWCSEQPAYAALVPTANPAKTKKTRESLGKAGVKSDSLLKEQLPAWFGAVRSIGSPITSAYLQTLLLTGARPGEVLALRWDDLNTQWRGLTIRDKVEGERVIPLTTYVWHLLHTLPRRSGWVFSSLTTHDHITLPNKPHAKACAVAGIDGLTLHGLRRSFKSLTEWLEIPAGVVAQIQGHKPSATAEKHYTVRPLDLVRVHHERIEAWVLEQAGVTFNSASEPGKLRVVAA